MPPFTALTGALGSGEGASPAHRDALALTRLLLEAGADANDGQALYNRSWGPDPQEDWLELLFEAGWAEHHGQREAQKLLKALEQPDPATPLTAEGAVPTTPAGAAMRTVTAAFTAGSEGRFDELGSMLAAEIDWQGLQITNLRAYATEPEAHDVLHAGLPLG